MELMLQQLNSAYRFIAPRIRAGERGEAAHYGLSALAKRIARLRGWRRAALSGAAGGLSVLAMAPLHLWPVLFLTLPVLVWLLDGAAANLAMPEKRRLAGRLWRAFLTGWFFGFGYFTAGLYWIGFAFLVEAEKFAWLMPLAVTAMPAGLALFYAAAAALALLLWRPGAARVIALALAFFALEWTRGHVLTGFPWNLLGYALTGNEALMQSAAVFSVYGLTVFAVLIFASPAAAIDPSGKRDEGRPWLLPVFAAVLLCAGAAWGYWRLGGADAGTVDGVRLRIVQANIPQAAKWRPENRQWIFERYLRLSADGPQGAAKRLADPTHVIWPESSVPFVFMLNGQIADQQARETLAKLLGGAMTLILGAERAQARPRGDGKFVLERVFNSLFVLDGGANVLAVYDKTHLVPFGEYLPLQKTLEALGIRQLTHLPGGFDAGEKRPLLQAPGAPAFSPLICYEIIFPGSVAASGARPAWLLNLTNDAWFGVTSGPYQHLHQARVRAIEEGLPVIRAANTGISAIIDPYGRYQSRLGLEEAGVIDSALPAALAPTPFALRRQSILLLLLFLAAAAYAAIVNSAKKRGN